MSLTNAFALHNGFSATWRELVDYIENGADGAIPSPYKVMTEMTVDQRLDVHFQARLCRSEGPALQTLSTRDFFNINMADSLPFGDTYRRLLGRKESLTEVTGPLPLHITLKPEAMDTAKRLLRDWALWQIKAHQAPRRPWSMIP